jgi:two-component system, NtrC family, sensor kinase
MPLYQKFQLNQIPQQSLPKTDLQNNKTPTMGEILVVDDTPANLKLVSDFLRESGFKVRGTKSGWQALKILEITSPDLILLDVIMPEMDGFETCRRLKAWDKTKDIPVIFMTAIADASHPEHKVQGLALGAVDYISKPIQLAEVLARVRTHLHLRFLTKQLQEQNAHLLAEIEVRQKTEEQLRLLERAIAASSNGIIISDPHQPENPVIYANSGFEQITGYKREEILGKNCRFLQQTDTNQPALEELRRAIAQGQETQVVLRNYRKDGTLFWNEFCLSPVRDETGNLTHFIGVQTDITEHKKREEALRLIVEGTGASIGEEFFRCCTHYLAQVLEVRYAVLTQWVKGSMTKVRTLAFWTGEGFAENFEYELVGTPCEKVFLGTSTYYPAGVQEHFLEDPFLVELGIQGYLGIPLADATGNILGHLAVMDTSPIENNPDQALILSIFAARAGAELERQRAEQEIRFLLSTTGVIAQADDFNTALSLMLRSCGEFMGWHLAQAWVPNADGTLIECIQSRCILADDNPKLSDPGLEEFRQQSLGATLAPDVGLPGRIWSSQQPEWLEDLSVEAYQQCERHEIVAAVGLKTAFGLPIQVDNQVLAVLIFSNKEAIPMQSHLLELIQAVATQVASLIGRKRIEEQLRKSEERLQLALEGSALGLWDWNIATGQTYFDSSWKKMLGYEVDEIENNYQSWANLLHPEDFPRTMEALGAYLEGRIPIYELEIRMLTKSGDWKWILGRGQVFERDVSGNPLRMTGTHRDIHDRKLAEKKLKKSEANLIAAQRVAHVGNWEFNLLTQEMTWSEEILNIFGLASTPSEPSLNDYIQRIHPDDRPLWQRIFRKSIITGKSYKLDFRIVRSDGSIHYLEGKGEAVVNEQGQVIKLFGTVLDITSRKKAEEALQKAKWREQEKAQQLELTLSELKHAQTQLIQAEKMSSLGRMVAGIAHEINNPVSFIYGNLTPAREYFKDLICLIELYQKTYPNPTPGIKYLTEEIDLNFVVDDWSKLMNSLQNGAERIEQIVVSLRSFSRLDESAIKQIDIHEGIDQTLLILQHRFRGVGNHPGIEVIKNYGQLPLITCYASQLNQVFMNLINNAIDALGSQPQPRVITISTALMQNSLLQVSNVQDKRPHLQALSPNAQYAVIRIADNGIGMGEEVCQRIFDPFFTTKSVGSGTGLGLAISHQIIVEKHKGHIRCISAPGQGTELIVEIPINLTTLS